MVTPNGRRSFLINGLAALAAGTLAACASADVGRNQKRFPRVGFLNNNSRDIVAPNLEAFEQGMLALGHRQGADYAIEARYADGNLDRLPALLDELTTLSVDVLVVGSIQAILLARDRASSTPIVMQIGSDPIAIGLVESLARPGGNVTGMFNLDAGLIRKRIELFAAIVSSFSHLALLLDMANPAREINVTEATSATQSLGMQLSVLPFESPADLDAAINEAARRRADALYVGGTTPFQLNRPRILELSGQHRLPTLGVQREFALAGGLMAYAASPQATYRHLATYVSKIIGGARPADLPIEQPNEFDFVVNVKTARALGLTVPLTVLSQATEVVQ